MTADPARRAVCQAVAVVATLRATRIRAAAARAVEARAAKTAVAPRETPGAPREGTGGTGPFDGAAGGDAGDIPGGGTVLFRENFDDASFMARGWYDGPMAPSALRSTRRVARAPSSARSPRDRRLARRANRRDTNLRRAKRFMRAFGSSSARTGRLGQGVAGAGLHRCQAIRSFLESMLRPRAER